MKFKSLIILYSIFYILISIFSYGFVDTNFPWIPSKFLFNLVHYQRPLTTMIHIIVVGVLFGFYGYVLRQVKNKKINVNQIWLMILVGVVILLFSFPSFSYDIFNYIATAKVTYFYKENPYLVMPIEFIGEPMLNFMHAANKIALYPPLWIIITAIPHFLGLGNILLTVFTFKAFVALFYLVLAWLIWRLSEKSAYSLAFFALNPLVIIETLVSGHNDVVMMAFALFGFYLLFQNRKILSFVSLLISIGIKYATIVLLPLFVLSSRFKKEKLITLSCWLMLIVFLLSPLREEIYSWYFIWIIALAALVPKNKLLWWLVMGFSFGLLLRYTPFLYFRSYGGLTPTIKTLTTFIPPGLVLIFYFFKNARFRLSSF